MISVCFVVSAMIDRPLRDPAGPTIELVVPSTPAPATPPAGMLAEMALAVAAWRRRVRHTATFRGFHKYQLRDLGLNPLDQW